MYADPKQPMDIQGLILAVALVAALTLPQALPPGWQEAVNGRLQQVKLVIGWKL